MRMQTPPSPSNTIPCRIAFESETAFRSPGLTRWNGRFRPVDDATGLDADAAAEVLSRRLSHQPDPSSLSQLPKTCPSPAIPYSLHNSSLLLLTHSTPFQKACLVTQRSQSCNYTATARLLIGPCAALSRAPLTYTSKGFDPLPTRFLCGTAPIRVVSPASCRRVVAARRLFYPAES
jgi:hypothetical protein